MATTTTQRLSAGTGEAAKFAGQAFTLHPRMEAAWSEMIFYRGYGRHRNERETSTVKTHKEWRADFVELARALADAVVEGALEPQKPVREDE